jgi:4'-phosphopantetheinyl transferase
VTPERGECHIWTAPVRIRRGWRDVLDAEERQQADRLACSRAAAVFVSSRVLQRVAGSAYLGVPASQVRVDRGCQACASGPPHGRPRFRTGTVDYSVSHTDDWVFLAAVRAGRVGVDLEAPGRPLDPQDLARVILGPREREAFLRVPVSGRAAWLLTCWTRKEAAMKLTGLGLKAPPGQVDVGTETVHARVPGWPAEAIYLSALAAPADHTATLATTIPVTTTRWYTLDSYQGREAQHGDTSPDAVSA